jgi:hypothetical protein
MTAKTSTGVKQAFKRFVELVKAIEDVHYVVAFDDDEPEISTYITKLDEAVSRLVFHAEFKIMEEFPQIPIEFHVWYLEGRPIESFVRNPPLFFAKSGQNLPD